MAPFETAIDMTQVALTLAGGTGLLGLALGIAFREITENFLASIYLSIQKPFEVGDLVEVTGLLGYVQRVTARTTILMTLDGNHVQIPNATNTTPRTLLRRRRRDDAGRQLSDGRIASASRSEEPVQIHSEDLTERQTTCPGASATGGFVVSVPRSGLALKFRRAV